MKIVRKYIDINNLRISYLEAGEGSPLILIHGIFSEAVYFKGIMRHLARHYKIYAIDLPMHGKSVAPKEYYSVSGLTGIVDKFVNKLSLSNLTMAALSGGALVAIEYCLQNPIKELVLMNPAGLSCHTGKSAVLWSFLVKRNIMKFYHHPIKRLAYLPYDTRDYFRCMFNKNYWRLLQENLNVSYADKLRQLRCKTTILWGKNDDLISPKFAAEYKNMIEGARLIMVEGTHDWPLTRPEEIMKYINN